MPSGGRECKQRREMVALGDGDACRPASHPAPDRRKRMGLIGLLVALILIVVVLRLIF